MLLPSGGNSVSDYEHLVVVNKQKIAAGFPPLPEILEFEEASCPEMFLGYWNDFLDISRRRGMNEGGPEPLTWQDINAWATVHSVVMSQVFIDVVDMLDSLWLEVYRKKNKPKKASKT